MSRPFHLLVLILSACLFGCTSPEPPAGAQNPAKSKIFVLRSEYFEKNWGKPELHLEDNGDYRLSYRKGSTLNYVFLHSQAMGEPVPAQPKDWVEGSGDPSGEGLKYHKQTWRYANILGQRVKWYQEDGGSGADFPCYKTVDFPLTAPDGSQAYYRVEVCADSEANAADWIRRVSW